MEKVVGLSVGKFLDRHLGGQSRAYQFFVARVYIRALPLVFSNAFPNLCQGIYQSLFGTREKRIQAFLDGSRKWGSMVQRMSGARVHAFNEIEVPASGHLVFSNHVNEIDFPYDCYFICKPYLANQVIKKTLVAYWWMRAMGSEVFDNRNTMSVSISVKKLLRGIRTNSYIVYPEGRNTYSESINPLKKGMVKLAYDHKIPIVVVLKSGVASYQSHQKGNKVGYRSLGTVRPTDYPNWEALRDYLQKIMEEGKIALDRETEALV